MGGGNAKLRQYVFVGPDLKEPGQNEQSISFLKDSLHFSDSQLKFLLHTFNKSKCATNSLLKLENFLHYMKLTATPFNFRALGNMQSTHTPDLNFLEFVVGLWNFMTLKDADMKKFVFLIFNLNSSIMTPEMLQTVIETIYFVEDLEDTNIANISTKLSTKLNYLSSLDSGNSTHLAAASPQTHPAKKHVLLQSFSSVCTDDLSALDGMVISPVMNLQNYLQKSIFGEQIWREIMETRLTSTRYQDIDSMMDLQQVVKDVANVPETIVRWRFFNVRSK